MSTFFARLCLVGWFLAMFAVWLERSANSLATLNVESWQIHLTYVIAIVVLTNLIFLVQALYLVFTLPVVYFAFIYFKSRAYSVPGVPISPIEMTLYLMEITFFSLIVFWNYGLTPGRVVRLKSKLRPTLQPPAWIK